MLDVLPDTVARRITVSLIVGFEFDDVTVTDGGCAGSTTIVVIAGSENPLASVAVAVTATRGSRACSSTSSIGGVRKVPISDVALLPNASAA